MQRKFDYRPAELCKPAMDGDTSVRWYLTFYCESPYSGKMIRFRDYCGVNRIKDKKRRLAELKKVRDARNDLLAKGWTPYNQETFLPDYLKPKITVEAALWEVLNRKKSSLRTHSFDTMVSRTKSFIAYLTEHGLNEYLPSEIKKRVIQDYVLWAQMRYSHNHVSLLLQHIKSLFKLLLEDEKEFITVNPCAGITFKRQDTPDAFPMLTKEEVEKVFKWTRENDLRLYLIAGLVYYGGIRPRREGCRLLVKHINLTTGLLELPAYISKNGKSQYVKIFPQLQEILKYYFSKSKSKSPELVLCTITDKPSVKEPGRNTIGNAWNKMKKNLGFPEEMKLYGLKHTACAELLENGASPYDVQLHFRHHDVALVIHRYARGRGKLPTPALDGVFSKLT